MALNLGIDHLVPWIRERGLHFLHRRQPHLHRVKPIDAPFRKRIEIRYLWGVEVEVALRVQLNPAVKRRTLQNAPGRRVLGASDPRNLLRPERASRRAQQGAFRNLENPADARQQVPQDFIATEERWRLSFVLVSFAMAGYESTPPHCSIRG